MKTTNKSWKYQAWLLMLTAVMLAACGKKDDAPYTPNGMGPYGYGSPCYGCAAGPTGAIPPGGTIVAGTGQIQTTQSLIANFALRFFTPTGTVGVGQAINNVQAQGTLRITRGDAICNIPPLNAAGPNDYSVTRTISPGVLVNGFPKTITGLSLELSGPAHLEITFPEISFYDAVPAITGFDGQQYPFFFGYDPIVINRVAYAGYDSGPSACSGIPGMNIFYFMPY